MLTKKTALEIIHNQGRVSVYSRLPDILRQCQGLFNARRPDFPPHQVFIAIYKLQKSHIFEAELEYLLRAMQTRLCTAGIYSSDEGCFIRIAIRFARSCLISNKIEFEHQVTPDMATLEAKVHDVQQVEPGIWQIQFQLLCNASKQGSVSELARSFCYKPWRALVSLSFEEIKAKKPRNRYYQN